MRTQMIDLRNGHIVDVYSYGIRFGWRILFFVKEYGTYEVFDTQTQKWYTATSKNLYPVSDESVAALKMLDIKKALIVLFVIISFWLYEEISFHLSFSPSFLPPFPPMGVTRNPY